MIGGRPIPFTDDDRRLLTDFVAVPSVSPLEGGDPAECERAQDLFQAAARKRGFQVVLHAAAPAAALQAYGVPAQVLAAAAADPEFLRRQPSVVVGLGDPGTVDRTLIFNFHADTVGPHIPPKWIQDRLHGRGAADDKGPGVAALIGVAAAYADRPEIARTTRVLIASVPGEEGGAMGVFGTRWLVDSGFVGRLMVFAEPTGMRSLDACSATMTAAIRVAGVDATDDHPTDGHNATVVLGWLASWLARRLGPIVSAQGAKLTIAGLHTGHQHNRVYGTGELKVNIAYYTAAAAPVLEDALVCLISQAREAFRDDHGDLAIVRRVLEDWDQIVGLVWLKRGIPPLANEDAAGREVLAIAGLPWADGIADGSAFTCDAVWAGGSGRYVVACGPGRLDDNGAHTPDEWIDLRDLEAYAGRVRDLVHAFADWTSVKGPM